MRKKGYLKKIGQNIAVALLALTLIGGILSGCGDKKDSDTNLESPTATVTAALEEKATPIPQEKIEISIAALKGPTAIGMVQVMDSAKKEETTNQYYFQLAGAADDYKRGDSDCGCAM